MTKNEKVYLDNIIVPSGRDITEVAKDIINQWEECRGCDIEYIIDITDKEDFGLVAQNFGIEKAVNAYQSGEIFYIVSDYNGTINEVNPLSLLRSIIGDVIDCINNGHKECYKEYFDYDKISSALADSKAKNREKIVAYICIALKILWWHVDDYEQIYEKACELAEYFVGSEYDKDGEPLVNNIDAMIANILVRDGYNLNIAK